MRDDLTEVGDYASFRKANEHGLVVLSMGLAYWMFKRKGRYGLCVRSEDAPAVIVQIGKFDAGNRFWPPRIETFREERTNFRALAIYALVLTTFFLAQQPFEDWFVSRGAVIPVAIYGYGEWWRTVTALTLHADSAHLVANLLGGAFFGFFVNRCLNAGLGWFLILLSGMVGNAISAAISYPFPHRSIGASTAVFGALGILAGFAVASMKRSRWGLSRRFRAIPLLGALALLALLGTGDVRTDVVAHICGFSAGLLLGGVGTGLNRMLPKVPLVQTAFFVASLLLLAAAWIAAARA